MVIFIGIIVFLLILALLYIAWLIDNEETGSHYIEVLDDYPPQDGLTDLTYRLYEDYVQLNQDALNTYKKLINESMNSRWYRD